MGRIERVNGRGWSVGGASVLGAAHVRRSVGNQDAFRCGTEPNAPVAVVADGHGADEYVRSATGARLAATLLAQELGRLETTDEAATRQSLLHDCARRFVDRWREAVLADAADDAFSAAEQEASGTHLGAADELVVRAYGTTVLGLCVKDGWLHALAIGDGDIGCVDAEGEHHTLCPLPESIGVQTASLAAADPLAAVRTDARRADEIVAAWACTDGFSTAQTDPEWRGLVACQLHEMLATRTPDDIAGDLAGWLQPAAEVGDDTTMVLILRTGLERPQSRGNEAKTYNLLATTLPPRKRRRRPVWHRL